MNRLAFRNLSHDIPAGIVVFLVALPLCLGVALASGAPLISGLIAGIIGGTVVALMSASHLSVSGPAAGMAIIVLSAIQDLGSFEGFLLAAFLAGGLQIGLGFLGAGILGSIFPHAVIRGMLFAIGLILILKQLPHAVGFGADPLVDETYSPETPGFILDEIVEAVSSISLGPLGAFMGAVIIIVMWDRLAKGRWHLASYLPGPLLAVVWGMAFEYLSRGTALDLSSQHLVSLPVLQSLTHFFDELKTPDFSQILRPEVAVHAVQIAVLASVETLLSIEALDRLDPLRRPTPRNRELIAQGVGNLLSASVGGLPITSVVVRSTTNLNAGAKSRNAAVIHGLLLLSSLMFLVTWINLIPLAVLAAILLLTGLRLADPRMFVTMWQRGRDQFIPFLVTILAILIDDLLKGVLIGSVVGLIFIIKSNFHSGITLTRDKNNYLIRFRKDATFLNKIRLRTLLDQIEPQSFVVIDGSRAEFMDRDILDCIADYGETARFREISVTLRNVVGVSGPLCAHCLDNVPSVEGCLHN